MARIGAFKPHEDAQRIGVMIEAAEPSHRLFQRILSGMAERRVADIVREAQRLGKVLVEPQRTRDHAADLRDFEAVGEAHAVVVTVRRNEHLRLVAQAAEGNRVDDAVPVALEHAAGATLCLTRKREFAAARE